MIASFLKQINFNASRLNSNELRPRIEILENIVSSTEKEFLAIGEKIQEFHQRANEISLTASEIAGKISGQEMKNVLEGFNRISSIVENLSGGMQMEKETIRAILDHFDALRQPLADFAYVIRNLNVLCNFIKIEIARLGLSDTSFFKLSADVGGLSGQIEKSIKSLAEQAEAAVISLNQNIALIENCNVRQKGQGKMILEKINANLSAISEKNILSSQTIAEISRTWERISLHVGEVVQSLQFHDITRQRVEHSREALVDLPQKLATWKNETGRLSFRRIFPKQGAKTQETPSGSYNPAGLVADTFDLQAAQLQSADQDLTRAMERILQSLRLVAKDATDISANILSVTGQDGGRKDTFLMQMEQDINVLADSSDDVALIRRDLTAAMSALSQTAMGMSCFVKDMDTIGIEMQRLAVNAQVHAAHLGDQGATLGVLAESIHQVSLNTSSMVQKIMLALQAVVENAEKLSGMAGAKSNDQLARVHEDFVTMLDPLKKIESDIGTLLPQIKQSGVQLADDIGRLVASVHIHETISSGLGQVADYLRTEVGKMTIAGVKRTEQAKSGLLEDLSAKYTMHSERSTHVASTRGDVEKSNSGIGTAGGGKIAPAMEPIGADGGDGLGDNVELF